MSRYDLPLLELFTRLRQADLPLGIDEYQLALRALQAGFGISDRAALKQLCRTLWVKSADEAHLLDYHFEQLMPQPLEVLLEQHETPPYTPLSPPPSAPHTIDSPPAGTSETATTSEMTVSIEDEIQVAQAVLQSASPEDGIPSSRYISTDEYFPVTRRQMKQSWRYLRRPIREGPPIELDVEATVKEVGHKGMFFGPVLVPRRVNRAKLLLLIDHGGSMVPFHMLAHRLVETVLRGGRLGKVGIYYFHNCPMEYLYHDRAYQEYERIEEIFNTRYSQWTATLIFSDAGAARGGLNQERIDSTKAFLDRLKLGFRYMAWLNPMPHSRWLGTTAGQVMQYIPMFDLSRRGLDEAISVLLGHPSHFKAQKS